MSTLLQQLQLSPKRGKAILSGLVSVMDGSLPPQSIAEHVALRAAKLLEGPKGDRNIGVDYIFFRRFDDGRSPQVAAYVVDNSGNCHTESEIAELHRRVWLNGTAPLIYIEWATRVDVLRCAAGPEFWDSTKGEVVYRIGESITTASGVSRALDETKVHRFSAWRLANGTFWENPENASWACAEKSAHKLLLQAAIDTDRALAEQTTPGAHPLMRRLLLLFLFTKHLEDRGVFPTAWFTDFAEGTTSFLDVLKTGGKEKVRGMVTRLKEKFNGDIFDLPGFDQVLTPETLKEFVALLDAKTLKRQRYLWEQFSFRYVPVEVLSHLYQHFAQEGTGAIYTPPFVADLILDHAMPYKDITGREKILDPTCGSGIFLVGAFRRLVHYWQSQNNWDRPGVPRLKEILKNSIFGVEMLSEAAHVAALNLALAVCEALQPKVIWNHLKFDTLIGSNLFEGDFFENLEELRKVAPDGFSHIVGNPPFDSKLTKAALETRRKEWTKIKIPDGQIAYRVTEECADLLADDGCMCLLQPSGFLYNAKARGFAAAFLQTRTVDAVLDFVSIRSLFEKADTKALALVVRRGEPEADHQIRHMTFRRTKSVHERLGFELDHYDLHYIPQDLAETTPWVWKANLLGGGRLAGLTSKVMGWPTLCAYLKKKGWTHGEGFIVGKKSSDKEALWLNGMPFLPTNGLMDNGIRLERIDIVRETKFAAPRKPERFKSPMVLIYKNESLDSAFWNSGNLAFKHRLVSVNSPEHDAKALEEFATKFQSLQIGFRAYCLLQSTEALVGQSTSILKRDIEQLPWPEEDGSQKLSWWEELLLSDAADVYAPLIRVGQKSPAVMEGVDSRNLKVYAESFVRLLGSVYSNLRASHCGFAEGMAYQAFTFGKKSTLEWPDDWSQHLGELVQKQNSAALRTRRIIRFYEGNTLIIVKPDRLRNWIASTAIRDADETLVDLQQQGF
jgi:hypothetical protein